MQTASYIQQQTKSWYRSSYKKLIIEEHHNKFGCLEAKKYYSRISRSILILQNDKENLGTYCSMPDLPKMQGNNATTNITLIAITNPRKAMNRYIYRFFHVELPRTSKGNTGILVVVDRFSKMVYFIVTQPELNAFTTGEDIIWKYHYQICEYLWVLSLTDIPDLEVQ